MKAAWRIELRLESVQTDLIELRQMPAWKRWYFRRRMENLRGQEHSLLYVLAALKAADEDENGVRE